MVRYLVAFAALNTCSHALSQDVVLIPNSLNQSVWVFSAEDGSMIDNAFITDPGSDNGIDVFDRPLEALISSSGSILICDQFADVVSEFNADGTFVGIFSLGGTRDTNIMDNIRGGHVLTQGPDAGDVLVTNNGRLNDLVVSQKNVKRLNPTDGSEETDFAFNRYGGIRGPFDVIEYNGEILVADEGQDKIVRYTLEGKFNERFTSSFEVPNLDFPQQMAIATNGNLLVTAFSTDYILEFAPDGQLVGQYQPGSLTLFRGVFELGNGNLLVTTTTGVYEVTRAGLVVETQASGEGFRYITRFSPPPGLLHDDPELRVDREPITFPDPDPRTRTQAVEDELGLYRVNNRGDHSKSGVSR
ncbi:MAG: hypothetical protein P1U42_07135 [Phycisphaerales bacterium]|nr:hypothetical protein [Phycisphaerales bacterium]